MKKKKTFYCEIAYILGIIVLALGNSFMARADFGMSMVIAPAYIIHLKVSEFAKFFTFGMSGYVFQLLLLIVLFFLVRKFEKRYLFSFVTAFVSGMVLDAVMSIVSMIPFNTVVWQFVFFAIGLIVSTTGVALLLHAHFPPEAYDLFVKEISRKYDISIAKVKTIYDCCSCALGIVLSLVFFGGFVGIYWGTIVCAVLNGWLIGKIGRFLENRFVFKSAFFKEKDKMIK